MQPDDGRVVSNFILQALKNKDITIYGDGSHTRSFQYVSNLVEGMIRMMECPDWTGPVNLGNPVEFTILELAQKVIAMTGSTSKIRHLPLPASHLSASLPVRDVRIRLPASHLSASLPVRDVRIQLPASRLSASLPVRDVRIRLPADDPRKRRPDISLARERLGWEPVVPLGGVVCGDGVNHYTPIVSFSCVYSTS